MHLQTLLTLGARVDWLDDSTRRLAIPASPANNRVTPYLVAQLDDYHGLPRRDFPWQPPCTLALSARVSAEGLPGTWGFGLWNDPFSFSLGLGGASRRFPALPNAAWFFYASPPNYLSFRDDLPAQGFLAATFHSPAIPAALLAIASPGLALGTLSPTARLLRSVLRRFIRQDACCVSIQPITDWHHYHIDWQPECVTFRVDGQEIFTTTIAPQGPLALVLWIDNQFAAFPPNGRISFGNLPTEQPAHIDLMNLQTNKSAKR